MAEQEQPKNAQSEPVAEKKKGFAAAFDQKEDAAIIRKLGIAKSLGGASSKLIVSLGVDAYLKSDDFKKKAQMIKSLI